MGLEPVTYAHPKLRPILEKTLGIPIFQEQVMKMAIEVAGYSAGEADHLRRAMGAWRKTGDLGPHADKMKKRLVENGVPADFSQQICDQIMGFGEYGFPESHAASFALLTYASSYLKAHYPETFLCALLNSLPMGFYAFHVLTSSFQREGVTILPVDTARSQWEHSLEKMSENENKKTMWAIRLGFCCVRGLNKDRVQKFIEKRESGVIDFFELNVLERSHLAIAAAPAASKRSDYWQALDPHRSDIGLKQESPSLFSPLDPLQLMHLDFELTETSLGTHPAALLKKHRWPYSLPQSKLTLAVNLSQQRGVYVFGIVQVIQSPPTAKGMVFITMEDESGFLNLVMRPDVFNQYKNLLQTQWALLVAGTLQNAKGSLSILVQNVFAPQSLATIQKLQSPSRDPLPHARIFNGY